MLGQILLLIACCVIAVAIARRCGLPPILGYLVVGTLLGPHALGWVEDSHALHLLGEIGIAFLLFVIGLEFSVPQFMRMRHVLLGLGAAQVLISTASGALIAWWLGIPPAAAIVVGGALAMSSTAIVIKQLTEQAELQMRHGNLSLGILLFQDLAAIPFMVVIPILADGSDGAMAAALGLALLKGVAAVALMLALGRYALRPIFVEAATSRSAELFTMTALMVSLFAAWITELLGLSLALGTFLAGMMLSETEFRHQLERELRPFKDTLLGLFFIVVGMRLDPAALPDIWLGVALLTVGLLFGKGGAIALLAWLWGRDHRVALRTGLVLGHGGEFGFALLALALGTGLLDERLAQPILAAIVVTMLLAPLLVRHNLRLVERLLPVRASPARESGTAEIEQVLHDVTDHVVICGYGRVGNQIARVLGEEAIPWVAVDLNTQKVRDAWEAGDRVFYGDATETDILVSLGAARAGVIVVSLDAEHAALAILGALRRLGVRAPVLVRTHDESHLEPLLDAGAMEVVPETLETSVMMAMRVMTRLGVDDARIQHIVDSLRDERYVVLRR